MTEIMPVPRILILLSYQQRASGSFFYCTAGCADGAAVVSAEAADG